MPWSSQIEGPSPNNTYGFKVTHMNLQDAKALHEVTVAIVKLNSVCLLCHFSVMSGVVFSWKS